MTQKKTLFLQYLQALVCITFLGKTKKLWGSAALTVPHWITSLRAASFPFNFASALWRKSVRRPSSKEGVEKMVTQQDFRRACLAQQPFLLRAQVCAVCPTVITGGLTEENLQRLFPWGETLLTACVDTPDCTCLSFTFHSNIRFLERFLTAWSLVRHLISCCACNLRI